jgi:2,4-dienoyl-CoA reductase-like NADH-dependent reductase (Old Yellow Enzyme family)/thioredoxin reductase
VDGERFPHLLSPGRIGSMQLRNRIISCPMGDRLANGDGSVSDAHLSYFEARARGGAALVLLGSVCVTYPGGAYAREQMALAHDGHLPGYAELARRVHSHGGKVAAQLVHNAGTALNDMVAGKPLLVPSIPKPKPKDRLSSMLTASEADAMSRAALQPGFAVTYREATEEDIERIVDWFATAAERCAHADLDGVELHAGHGYLFDEFLSPASNTRTDRWGGPVENRARLLCETVREIRRRLGADFPLWTRLNAFEAHREGGTTLDDALATARLAVEAGLDAVHVSAYADASLGIAMTASHTPHVPGALVPAAAAVKRAVSVPVITFGRLEPDAAEAVLARGDADFVAMGRKLLADPDLPVKLATGRDDDVRPCIYQYRCIGNISVGRGVRCVVNPATGREHEVAAPVAGGESRRVLVVGGGPAGLEAARLLAHDGHRVELWEASASLGGQLTLAAAVEEPLARLQRWLVRQVEGLPIHVRTGRRATAADCVASGADVVVVATGGVPSLELAPRGARRIGDLATWLRDDGDEVGRRVAVLGGERGAIAVARLCRDRGRMVQVVAPTSVFAADMGLPGRFRAVHDALDAGVELCAAGDLDANGTVDTVIVVDPVSPADDLVAELTAAGVEVHVIGDRAPSSGVERERGGLEAAFADAGALRERFLGTRAARPPRAASVTSGGGDPRS